MDAFHSHEAAHSTYWGRVISNGHGQPMQASNAQDDAYNVPGGWMACSTSCSEGTSSWSEVQLHGRSCCLGLRPSSSTANQA